ncbi:MAG: hypothetical protein QXF12_01625 [Candidatus Aenigmatarchaeota archaeon]
MKEKEIKLIYKDENCPFLKMTELWFKNRDILYEKINFRDFFHKNQKNSCESNDDKYPKIVIENVIVANGYKDLIKKESYILFLLGLL